MVGAVLGIKGCVWNESRGISREVIGYCSHDNPVWIVVRGTNKWLWATNATCVTTSPTIADSAATPCASAAATRAVI